MARLFGFAIVITCFWYFYYRNEHLSAASILLGALWLLIREARQLMAEWSRLPGRPSSRAHRKSVD